MFGAKRVSPSISGFAASPTKPMGIDPRMISQPNRYSSDALAWALVGALDIQIVRWAVWNQIELPELRVVLRAAARAILPRTEPRVGLS